MAIRFLSGETIDGDATFAGDITISTSRPIQDLILIGELKITQDNFLLWTQPLVLTSLL